MQKNEVTKVYIVLVVIGALGMVSKNVSQYVKMTGFNGLEKLQRACLLETTRILRNDYNDLTGGIWITRMAYKKTSEFKEK